jgi:hypothetical protein
VNRALAKPKRANALVGVAGPAPEFRPRLEDAAADAILDELELAVARPHERARRAVKAQAMLDRSARRQLH